MNIADKTTAEIIELAYRLKIPVPAFNIPYLPMMRPVVEAIREMDSFALIEVARLEWEKFESRSPQAVREEYLRWADPNHMRLHLDHIPVIDEDGQCVDYLGIIKDAIDVGFQSVMVDGSRLDFEENIHATQEVAAIAHTAGIACEAELGAVLGHEAGPLPPYEELFRTGKGFTDVEEARRFVEETGVDWLSVAAGNIHGSISKAAKDRKKVQARLNLTHIALLAKATGIPLVLHGGSGVKQEYILGAAKLGMTKINIGTEIRQAYEGIYQQTGDSKAAEKSVFNRTCWILGDYLQIAGSYSKLRG
jgi:ketose-bisphosphate aldolase